MDLGSGRSNASGGEKHAYAQGELLSLYDVAVLLPCRNEGQGVAFVVAAFRRALPTATVYVYDNGSTDDTVAKALAAGAIVRHVTPPGKGHVVRRMFTDVDADVYVIADGDGTYDPAGAPVMVQAVVTRQLDMVVGARVAEVGAHCQLHAWGNALFNRMLQLLFGGSFRDIFSGYRAFSRRFVKSFPALSSGFEIETELTVHAIELGLATAEIDFPYGKRAAGTSSKLNTITDGARILWTLLRLSPVVRPILFYGCIAMATALASLLLGSVVVAEWLNTGFIARVPTAVLATGLAVVSVVSLTCGLILDSVSRGRRELKRLGYLAVGERRQPAGASLGASR